jgi:hypothetical protein
LRVIDTEVPGGSPQHACQPLHDLHQPDQAWKLKTVVKIGLTKRG